MEYRFQHHHYCNAEGEGAWGGIKSADHRFCFPGFCLVQRCAVQKRKALPLQIEMMLLSALVKFPPNVRTIPYPVESVQVLAETILAILLG